MSEQTITHYLVLHDYKPIVIALEAEKSEQEFLIRIWILWLRMLVCVYHWLGFKDIQLRRINWNVE